MSLLRHHRPQSLVSRNTHIDYLSISSINVKFTEHTLLSYLSFPFPYIVMHCLNRTLSFYHAYIPISALKLFFIIFWRPIDHKFALRYILDLTN